MDFSGGGGGGATLSEMYQSARRLLLSARDGVARVERLASAPTSSSYSSSVPLVGAVDPAGAEGVPREVAQIQGGNSDGRPPIPSMRRCPILLRLRALQQGTPIMSVGHRMLHRPRSLSTPPPRSMHFLLLAVIVGSPVRLFVPGLSPAASVEAAWESVASLKSFRRLVLEKGVINQYVIVAKEAAGDLEYLVRQLSPDQFENKSRRMHPANND